MRWYYRRRADGLVITHARPEHAAQLEELQRICFPTLEDAQRFNDLEVANRLLIPMNAWNAIRSSISTDWGGDGRD